MSEPVAGQQEVPRSYRSLDQQYTFIGIVAHMVGRIQMLNRGIASVGGPDNSYARGDVIRVDRINHAILTLCRDYLPSGSGFDAGTSLLIDESHVSDRKATKSGQVLRFYTQFHHMDEHGSYSHWTEHNVDVRPQFEGEYDVRVGGPNSGTDEDRRYVEDAMIEHFSSHDVRPRTLAEWIDLMNLEGVL